jgi:hypothetical protein
VKCTQSDLCRRDFSRRFHPIIDVFRFWLRQQVTSNSKSLDVDPYLSIGRKVIGDFGPI